MSTNSDQDPWALEEVPPRKKLISFIIQRVKAGATDEQLLEVEVPEFLEKNGLPLFPKWDVQNIITWARNHFS